MKNAIKNDVENLENKPDSNTGAPSKDHERMPNPKIKKS